MTRAKLPEDTRPDYDAPPETKYAVVVDGARSTVTDPEIAEKLSRNGYRVTAKTGWV